MLQDNFSQEKKKRKSRFALTVQDIALIGVMTAVIEVSKLAMSFLPNIELVTFWIIMFTLFFGPKVLYSIFVFILIEISLYGVYVWVIMYLYMWPFLALIVYLFRKKNSVWFYSILSGFFGLCFGAICSVPYIFIGAVGGGLGSGFIMAFNWWIAGIPFDILHGIANFAIMLVLYTPVRALLTKVRRLEN